MALTSEFVSSGGDGVGVVVAVVALGDEHLGAALDVGRTQRKQDAHHGQG